MFPALSELLKLPAGERAELAMALWESLSEAEREAGLDLTSDEAVELDRRWADHVQRPESAIPWDDVRRKLTDREGHAGSFFDPKPPRRRSKRATGTKVDNLGSARPFDSAWTTPSSRSRRTRRGFDASVARRGVRYSIGFLTRSTFDWPPKTS